MSTLSGGKEYWITQESRYAFKNYLSLNVFYGNSQRGLFDDPNIGLSTSNAATTHAGLLVIQKGGQDAASKMLGNLATSMTNA